MQEYISSLLDSALYYGMTITEFNNCSCNEVRIFIEANTKKEKTNLQWEAQLSYTNAMLIGRTTIRALGSKENVPKLNELYPSLFEEKQPLQQDWRIAKANLLKFAEVHNKKRGENINDS